MSRPFNTIMMDKFKELGEPEPCFKTGHKSREAAEAALRSLLKRQDQIPDPKNLKGIGIYECPRRSCRERPWHTGHSKFRE